MSALRCISVIILIVCCVAETCFAASITEIDVSPDLKRAAVKLDGELNQFNQFSLSKPSRIVIEFKNVSVNRTPKIVGLENGSGVTIRTANSPNGARVVFDFGDKQLPEYKLHKMGTNLLLSMSEWSGEACSGGPVSMPKEPRFKSQKIFAAGDAALEVKSVKIVNGEIQLDVANHAYSGATYRVNVGLNFNAPEASKMRVRPLFALQKEEKSLEITRRIGPRKR
jgi:hypothetical protein